MKHYSVMIKKMMAIISIIIVMLSFTACGTTKIDPSKHITVTFKGYDGYSTPELTIDTDAINAYIEDQEKFVENLKKLKTENEFWVDMCSSMTLYDLYTIRFTENYQNLSNGDVVRVEIVMNDFLSGITDFETLQETIGIELTSTTVDFTVDGLEEAKVIDFIGLVKEYVVFEGANGGCTATVQIPEDFMKEIEGFVIDRDDVFRSTLNIIRDNQLITSIRFQCNNANNLSNGDTFELYINDSRAITKFLSEGYVVPEKTTITVSGLGEYISSSDQLTPEIKNDLDNLIKEYIENASGTYSSYPNFKILNYYWGTLNPNAVVSNAAASKNQLLIAFEYENWFKQYGCFNPEIILFSDGTHKISLNRPSTGFTMESLLSSNYTYDVIEY